MLIIDDIKNIQDKLNGCVLSIGNFDGLHLGHVEIIETAKRIAAQRNIKSVALMTFDPHPAVLLRPSQAPGVLTPIGLKKSLISSLGVETLIVVKDSLKLLSLSPKAFVDDFLMQTIKPSIVVEGSDFNFGYGRSGSVDTLKQLGQKRGFDVVSIDLERMNFSEDYREKVSSTLIRNFIEQGRMDDAVKALGRDYRLIGRVVTGRGIGKKLGFATANLDPIAQIIPAEGVYAGFVEIGSSQPDVEKNGKRLAAVFSIGRAKTIETNHPLLIEAHVLVQDQVLKESLYGKYMAMDFKTLLRKQKIFDGTESLIAQIDKDCANARKILGLA